MNPTQLSGLQNSISPPYHCYSKKTLNRRVCCVIRMLLLAFAPTTRRKMELSNKKHLHCLDDMIHTQDSSVVLFKIHCPFFLGSFFYFILTYQAVEAKWGSLRILKSLSSCQVAANTDRNSPFFRSAIPGKCSKW